MDNSENILGVGGGERLLRGAQILPFIGWRHPRFAYLQGGGTPRFYQILIIIKTKIAQIKPYNTYRGV